MIQVYTGTGKGKTTAALGLAMRALGHGLKVYIIQFMKGNIRYGELETARQLSPNFVIKQMGRETFVDRNNPDKIDIELAQRAFHLAKDLEALLDLLDSKPDHVELILTGRYAKPEVIERADLVTEMVEVKHYYREGIHSREGIEV